MTSVKKEVKTEVKMEVDNESMVKQQIDSLESLGPYIEQNNNAESFVYFSKVPQVCLDKPCMLGVDEAGRGPVLGPMVYGIAFCPLEDIEVLKTLGCADSKQLTEEKRNIIFDDICTKEYASSSVSWAVEVISPNVISNSMFRRSKHSLNEVSMDSAIGLINRAVALGANIAEVYVDTVGPPEKYEMKLSKLFPDFKITVAKKADSTYPIVSAASICAKVSRDHALKVWKFPEGLTIGQDAFGSGYPGDPVTKRFLQENIEHVFGFPRLVRFSWSTSENILLAKALKMEFEDEDDSPKSKATKAISNFFNADKKTGRARHTYFRDRCLANVVNL